MKHEIYEVAKRLQPGEEIMGSVMYQQKKIQCSLWNSSLIPGMIYIMMNESDACIRCSQYSGHFTHSFYVGTINDGETGFLQIVSSLDRLIDWNTLTTEKPLGLNVVGLPVQVDQTIFTKELYSKTNGYSGYTHTLKTFMSGMRVGNYIHGSLVIHDQIKDGHEDDNSRVSGLVLKGKDNLFYFFHNNRERDGSSPTAEEVKSIGRRCGFTNSWVITNDKGIICCDSSTFVPLNDWKLSGSLEPPYPTGDDERIRDGVQPFCEIIDKESSDQIVHLELTPMDDGPVLFGKHKSSKTKLEVIPEQSSQIISKIKRP